tara:strand:- start:3124 stop:3816 length:693 start_codon:yes stop_codon:yes gene_type:complete
MFIVWLFKWINKVVIVCLLLAAAFFFVKNCFGFDWIPSEHKECVMRVVKNWGIDDIVHEVMKTVDKSVNSHIYPSEAQRRICGESEPALFKWMGIFSTVRVWGFTVTPKPCHASIALLELISTPSTGPLAFLDHVWNPFWQRSAQEAKPASHHDTTDEDTPHSATDTPRQGDSSNGSDTPPKTNESDTQPETGEETSSSVLAMSKELTTSILCAVTGAAGYGLYWFFTQG